MDDLDKVFTPIMYGFPGGKQIMESTPVEGVKSPKSK